VTRPLRRSFLEPIVDELWRTRRVLEALYGGPLAERRPNVEGALRARAGVLGALHRRQVSLLAAYRAGEPPPPRPEREARLAELLLTVNALAAGLGGHRLTRPARTPNRHAVPSGLPRARRSLAACGRDAVCSRRGCRSSGPRAPLGSRAAVECAPAPPVTARGSDSELNLVQRLAEGLHGAPARRRRGRHRRRLGRRHRGAARRHHRHRHVVAPALAARAAAGAAQGA
jgi:hypothetical protein